MARQRGFTLIELLVVIAILSLLVVAFLPNLSGASTDAKITATEGTLLQLQTAIRAFEIANGAYPSDDFSDSGKLKLQVKADNGVNTGIESLLAFLAANRTGFDVDSLRDNLANTDADQYGGSVPRLDTDQRQEITDAFRTPLAYFSSTSNAQFARAQRIQLPGAGGEVIECKAWSVDGRPLGGSKFQLVSAGPDQVFNTQDDITLPKR